MYIEYIERPLHNLLLWITGFMPGNSLALAIIVFALLTKFLIIMFIYHGHVTNMIHHQIRKHSDSLAIKHHKSKQRFQDEVNKIYDHYSFNPWKGILIVLIQFLTIFSILNFLYSGAQSEFSNLNLVIMENVFMATSMSTSFMGMDLFNPVSIWSFLFVVFVVQFLSLEIYLLTKRKLHRHPNREELVEHLINLILAGFIMYSATVLPLALTLYWFFFLLFGVLIKIFFDQYIDKKIVKKIQKIEKKIEKAEEPEVRKFDETFIFLMWKLFNPKSTSTNYSVLKRRIHKKFMGLHHSCYLHHPQRKLYEEPFMWAMIFLVLSVIGFNIWK